MNRGALLGIFIVIIIAAFALYWFAVHSNPVPTQTSETPTAIAPSLVKATVTSSGSQIVINADKFESLTGPAKVIDEQGCAGGKCIFVEDLVLGKPVEYKVKITYKFNVAKAGTYIVWVHHWWKDECGNSLLLSFDGDTPKLMGDDGTINYWRWPPAMKLTVELSEGEHILEVIPREDGLKFDQIILTTDEDYYPTGVVDAM